MPHRPLSRRVFALLSLALLAPVTSCAGANREPGDGSSLFTPGERDAVRLYWNEPGRYTVLPSGLPSRPNVSVAGSLWYWRFVRLAPDPAHAQWWQRKYAYERAKAFGTQPAPPDPGTFPGIEPPPALYEPATPTRYTVRFAPGDAPFVYDDAIDFGKRPAYYAYYRSTNGVQKYGTKVKDVVGAERERLLAVFTRAGRSDFERRVLAAVSAYEGGFDAVNTYDTGYVSIGFIQFITAIDGTGSLANVLAAYKAANPVGFQGDFRRFGVDVAANPATLVCVDPTTGTETRSADAVRRVIDDKRLTAVFERAGRFAGFREAQVAVARANYYPADDVFPVAGLGAVRVGDVVTSEAGMATLMDKKVNRGNVRDFAGVAERIVREHGLKSVAELAKYERSLIAAMKYRGDFLNDATLSQPAPEPSAAGAQVAPRL